MEDKLWQEQLPRRPSVTQNTVTRWAAATDDRTYSTESNSTVDQPHEGLTHATGHSVCDWQVSDYHTVNSMDHVWVPLLHLMVLYCTAGTHIRLVW